MKYASRLRAAQRAPRFALGVAVAVSACLGWPQASRASKAGGSAPQAHFSAPKMPAMPHMNAPAMGFQMPKPPHGNSGSPQIPKYGVTMPKPPSSNSKAAKQASANLAEAQAQQTGHGNAGAIGGTGPRVGRAYYHGRRSYAGYGYGRRYGYGAQHNMMSVSMRHLQKLVRDLDSITPNRSMTQAHKNVFSRDLIAVVDRGPVPNPSGVQTLANDLVDTMARRKSPTIDTTDLAWALKAVMNSGHLENVHVSEAIAQSQAILGNGGAQQADIKTVTTDLKMIATLPNNAGGQGLNGPIR
jgi:hypothetical protein